MTDGGNIRVAIDGPSASGKSTVSRRVAAELNFIYVDSGALYRGLTWQAVRAGVDTTDAAAVLALLARVEWRFYVENRVLLFALDGVTPGAELRAEPVRERVSDVAAIPGVRAFVVARLQETARFGPVVMEGRDIGTVVFPETAFKFYLDADPEERARRRLKDIVDLEGRGDVSAVRDSLARRDTKDRTRRTAPLQVAPNAVVIDSTRMSVDDVVQFIVARVRAGAGPYQ